MMGAQTMTEQTVLISGAGVAGPTLAYWLARHGFRPTVVERAAGLRSSGNPVDVRGPALDVVDRMGLLPTLRAAASGARRRGGRVASVPAPPPPAVAVVYTPSPFSSRQAASPRCRAQSSRRS